MATPGEDPKIARARARVGTLVRDKWRLDNLLGVGGTAAVYAATHRNAKRVAIKVLHPELSLDPEARTRFVREGYAANRIGHDGAVSVLDDDVTEDGSAFLVMELLDGETFEERWQLGNRILPAIEVLSLVDPVLDVLAAAHDKGIIHRDLKPENMFLTRDGRVKVLDFGLARLREIGGLPITVSANAIMGTPAFMPPEQARGRSDGIDARTDLWALGASMYTLLTGEYVHAGETVQEILVSAITRPVRSVSSVAPHVPGAVAELVDRALAFDVADRWPNASSMQRALREAFLALTGKPIISSTRPTLRRPATGAAPPTLVSGSGPAGATPPPVASSRSARTPRPRWVGLLAGAVVLGVAAALVLARLVRSDPPHPVVEVVVEPHPASAGAAVATSVAPAATRVDVTVEAPPVPPMLSAIPTHHVDAPRPQLPRVTTSASAAVAAPASSIPAGDPLDRRR